MVVYRPTMKQRRRAMMSSAVYQTMVLPWLFMPSPILIAFPVWPS